MFSINENATVYVDELLNKEEEFGVKSYFLENQSTVIDCGVNAPGSFNAGLLYSIVSMGGLGRVSIVPAVIDGIYLHFAQVWLDQPCIACLGSQKPVWKIKTEGFSGTAFGPARSSAQKPKAIYSAINYSDDAEMAVINIESTTLPTAKEIDAIAKQCSTDPECVVALVARRNSIVGSIATSTRSIEWALNRLYQGGYDTRDIISATSATPIAPLKADDQEFIGSAFDAIAYYGMVSMYSKSASEAFNNATSAASKLYGKSFKSLLKDEGGDFSKVDPAMFGPARLIVNGLDGSLNNYGKLNAALLLSSFGLKI